MAHRRYEQRFGGSAISEFKARHHNRASYLLDGVDRVLGNLTPEQVSELATEVGTTALLDAAARLAEQVGPAGFPEDAPVLDAEVVITAVRGRAALRNESAALASAARGGDTVARDRLTTLHDAASPVLVED